MWLWVGISNLARNGFLFLLVSASLFAASSNGFGQDEKYPTTEENSQKDTSPTKDRFFFGALAFGDVYYVPSHHLPAVEGDVGAWLRRVYLTGDFNLNKQLFARVRVEINQDGDFVSNAFTAGLKDVYLGVKIRRHKLLVGLVPSPTFDIIDALWGYRHLERTPLDLQGEPSRDWGFAAQGPLNEGGSVSYRAMVGTGSEFGKETGEGQKFMGAVSFGNQQRGLLVDVYGDYQKLPGPSDRKTFQVYSQYTFAKGRVGGLYSYQDRQEDPRLEVASAYGIADLSSSVSLIGRVDRLMAPSPNGNDIDYLPFDPSAKATLLIGALEWRIHRYVSLLPNVETILYDEASDGERPKQDLYLRLTFFVHH